MPAPAPTRWIADDYGTLDFYKRCTVCRRWLPVNRENFVVRRRDPLTGRPSYDAWCREDRNAHYRARWAAMPAERRRAINQQRMESQRADAERIERRRASKRKTARRARVNDLERVRRQQREASRRRYAKMKADPAAYADYLARTRMNYRLRRERQGLPVRPGKRAAVDAWRQDTGKHGLPPEPLLEWLRAVIEREAPEAGLSANDPAERIGLDTQALAHQLGVDTRAIWRIQHGEHATVSLAVADRLLTNYGRPVVIRSRDLEARLVAWAHELPGNGTRLLRYMDRAEQVAHLADVSLMSLGDLWPELDA
jgi:hypothetical protein